MKVNKFYYKEGKLMGRYVNMGICHQIEINKGAIVNLKITDQELLEFLNNEMDLKLYDRFEQDEKIIFKIKENIILDQLHDFLKFQFSLYDRKGDYKEEFDSVLRSLSHTLSLQEIVAMVEKRSVPFFRGNKVDHVIPVSYSRTLRIQLTMIVIFMEGKIQMEGYRSFLKFIEVTVREACNQWSVSGAFRCLID